MQIRKRASVVCTYSAKVLVFKGVDPTTGFSYWFLPGGKIEPGETPWVCGQREALEETGYRLRILVETEIVANYKHWWNGTHFSCQTYFYKGVLDQVWHEPIAVVDVDYNKGAAWRPLENAKKMFAYTPEILDAVLRLSS